MVNNTIHYSIIVPKKHANLDPWALPYCGTERDVSQIVYVSDALLAKAIIGGGLA